MPWVLAIAAAACALGQPSPQGAIYDVRAGADLAAIFSMAVAGAFMDHEKHDWDGTSPCHGRGHPPAQEERAHFFALAEGQGVCDRSEVNALDQTIIGHHSNGARILSDVLLLAMLGAPSFYAAGETVFSEEGMRGRRFAEDALVGYEAIAATALVTNVVKFAVQRPRPLTYDPEEPKSARFDGDAHLSFPSGHASVSFAAATAIALGAFERRQGAEPWIAASVSYAVAGLVAYLRTAAGKHFITDVLAGAAIGVATSAAVVRLHVRDAPRPEAGQAGQSALRPVFALQATF